MYISNEEIVELDVSRGPIRTMLRCASGWVAVALLALLANDAAAQFPDPLVNLVLSVTTDQPSYIVGEPVEIRITAHNSGPSPITLWFPSSFQSLYEMDGVYSPPAIGFAIHTQATIPAMGSHDWLFQHNWDEYDLAVGSHSVIGTVGSNLITLPHQFEIAESPPVTSDVFIDFETYPSGDSMAGVWRQAYDAWGVAFRSEGGDLSITDDVNGNHLLHTPSGAHPFNVVADFSMPVHRISADVGTAANETVRMFAYDADQNLLGMVESPSAAAYPDLIGQLEFTSAVPIASVKWLSSNQLATVLIDNLRLEVGVVPEPSTLSLALLPAAAIHACRRLRGLGTRDG